MRKNVIGEISQMQDARCQTNIVGAGLRAHP